jgi:hypothetical protein
LEKGTAAHLANLAQKEYHFPVKSALSCSIDGMLDDMNLVEQLID